MNLAALHFVVLLVRDYDKIKARKPSWKSGSSFAIKRKPVKSLPKIEIDDDVDLIDEDSLLTEEDLKKPQLPPGKTLLVIVNLEVQGKPAKIAFVEGLRQRKNLFVWSTGKCSKLGAWHDDSITIQASPAYFFNCGLGDAFRCSTCPYRGLPPFKLGEKVC
ncbi:unnamed protein product [Thlaspi arvense]|uniref:Anamorsin C-terminal domain-containing protein n=1 Tax=Thlaspi arvense TaxID=13288 RepID=A0AAU9RWP4_THLAR|nr:unnamed protein product [Thlaspi arvense]